MQEQEKINDYDSEPVAFCAKCFSLKIKHEDSLDIDYCGDCGCSCIKEASVYDWEKLYEKKYGHKYVVKSNDPKKNLIFKLTRAELMDKLYSLPQWKSIVLSLYPKFPEGFGKIDSIILLFDKLIKDNRLDALRLKLIDYIKNN